MNCKYIQFCDMYTKKSIGDMESILTDNFRGLYCLSGGDGVAMSCPHYKFWMENKELRKTGSALKNLSDFYQKYKKACEIEDV